MNGEQTASVNRLAEQQNRTLEEQQFVAAFGGKALHERNIKSYNSEKLERLRDEFAMAALPACYKGYVDHAKQFGWDANWKDGIAEDAYQIADAMLKAREIK